MPWLTPKTNWILIDYINAQDFNRIESNTLEMWNYLKGLGYSIPDIYVVSNRTNLSYETIESMQRIEDNLDLIRANAITPFGWFDKETWNTGSRFYYSDANRLERNLKLLKDLEFGFKYSGTFSCGEGGLIF